MIGSTFIHTRDPFRLKKIADDIDALDEFDHVNLDELITLDFEEICSSLGTRWSSGQPVVFDEKAGLAIFQVNAEALQKVIGAKNALPPDKVSDLERLEKLVSEHGYIHIYEMATF